jgi:rRNA maturation RNase YbeY
MKLIAFFSEDTDFKPTSTAKLRQWISNVIKRESHLTGEVNYIFCSRPYLLELNQTYLNHHDHTDILTFDQSTLPETISGDIYISVDQVRENALLFGDTFEQELRRVMIHGILHLLGYNDKTPEEQREMRKKEEAYLSL